MALLEKHCCEDWDKKSLSILHSFPGFDHIELSPMSNITSIFLYRMAIFLIRDPVQILTIYGYNINIFANNDSFSDM